MKSFPSAPNCSRSLPEPSRRPHNASRSLLESSRRSHKLPAGPQIVPAVYRNLPAGPQIVPATYQNLPAVSIILPRGHFFAENTEKSVLHPVGQLPSLWEALINQLHPMEKPDYLFKCKVEELPVIAGFLQSSYVSDQAQFVAYSPKFNEAYLADFHRELAAADEVVNPVKFTREMTALTKRLNDNSAKLRPLLDRLEGYVDFAKDTLPIAPKDFGISPLRQAITSKDMESVTGKLKVLIQSVDDHLAALQAQGFTTAARTELGAISTAIKADNQEQDDKLKERRDHVQANTEVLNTLWARMQQILKAGKILYKSTNPAKLEDYTMDSLMKRVRRDRKKPRSRVGMRSQVGEGRVGSLVVFSKGLKKITRS